MRTREKILWIVAILATLALLVATIVNVGKQKKDRKTELAKLQFQYAYTAGWADGAKHVNDEWRASLQKKPAPPDPAWVSNKGPIPDCEEAIEKLRKEALR